MQQPSINEDLRRLFVNQNYPYYARKWRQVDSWNWAAFFVGVGWMAYRKMYLYSWIFIAAVIVETILEIVLGVSGRLSNAINLGIAAFVGSQGNSLYKAHVETKVREIAPAGAQDEATRIRLAREGGTNVGAAFGFVVAFIVLVCLLTAIGG